MTHLDSESCPVNPDVWVISTMKADGSDCYESFLLYTDDAIVISENAEGILRNRLGKYFELKLSSIGPPTIYLGSRVRKISLDDGKTS